MHRIMDNKSFLFFALFIIFCVPLALSQEVEDEQEFSYDVNSPNGPNHWGELNPKWSTCNNGDMQSPIDLTRKRVQTTSKLGRLDRDYKPANATLINQRHHHDMMLTWVGEAGHIHINGTEYQLDQAHWHTPTEHTINGRRFNLELHLVHKSIDAKVAVVGILYKIGRPDSFLATMEPYLKEVSSIRDVEKSVGIIDPRQIKFGSRNYYRYIGSLTTPPCTQSVIWTIVQKVRTVSPEQLRIFREAIYDELKANARPVHDLNNRWLKLYQPDNYDETD
ncbi:putative carbonic anhydrase [Helianthus annuus]|nr:putative carbonic anhydrase [Helianthus annuus]